MEERKNYILGQCLMQGWTVGETMVESFLLWQDHACEPGSFGMAVLMNDLKEACRRADPVIRHRIFDIVACLYNYFPMEMWGSPERVEAWREKIIQEQERKHNGTQDS